MRGNNIYIANDLTTNEKNIKKLFLNIKKEYLKSNKKELVIVNIGTDKNIGDSLAPIVGRLSQNKLKAIKMYGTTQNPIHALNLSKKYKEIKSKHKDAFIIGVDASVSSTYDKGTILLRNLPVRPGKGIGKNLEEVGDISIVGIVEKDGLSILGNGIRLSNVWDMAESISKAVIKLDKSLYRINSKGEDNS